MTAVARPVDTREQLLLAAEGLVDERGPSGVSLREVARRVGVSHGAPLRHFASLSDLLTAVATEGFRLLVAGVDAAMATAEPTGRARLAGAGRGYVDCATVRPGLFALMFRRDLLAPDDPELRTASWAAFAQLTTAIEAAQADGWHPDESTALLAGATWAGVHGIAVLWSQGAMQPPTGNTDLDGQLAVLFRTLALPDGPGPRPTGAPNPRGGTP
ncbi:MAG: TetR/AcrR family transcriptional regulator [Acidimicrobiia bacterium]|jgi:AcrR family transcriptional regulator